MQYTCMYKTKTINAVKDKILHTILYYLIQLTVRIRITISSGQIVYKIGQINQINLQFYIDIIKEEKARCHKLAS
jgi:hypothetical protein